MCARSQESEKPLESVHNFRGHSKQLEHPIADFHALCGSLIERYKSEKFAFHFHCLANPEGSRSNADFCALISGSRAGLNGVTTLAANALDRGMVRTWNHDQYPPVLVDVAECIEYVDRTLINPVPVMVGLQSFD